VKKNALTKGLLTALLLASPMVGAESRYPAADFKPEIIAQDKDLIAKHSQAAQERALTEQAEPDAAEAGSGKSAGSESALAQNYPIGLIVLALAGFIFWSGRRSGGKVQEVRTESAVSAPAAPVAGGETGVARYLKSLPGAGETGVAKYLKNLPAKAAAVETGVARYLKNLPAKAVAETGVAKYLRNRDASAR
jgi:hypothetical protein